MNNAEQLSLAASGLFFITGLLTGIWKYAWLARDAEKGAPFYVDTAHRAALMYSFAALVVWKFSSLSPYSEELTLWAAAAPLFFFAFAIFTYLLHGILRDTDNQFRVPHKLGRFELPRAVFHGSMWLLIIGELGGFLVLFTGFISQLP